MKTCLKCGQEKPISEYHAKRGKPQPQCKTCRSDYMAKHYKENRPRERAKRKSWYEANREYVCEKMRTDRLLHLEEYRLRSRLRRKGMTFEEYTYKVTSQKNACEICHSSFGREAYKCSYIDHCHKTGKFRGLLCSQCNTAIGLLKESETLFKACITYLKKYKK